MFPSYLVELWRFPTICRQASGWTATVRDDVEYGLLDARRDRGTAPSRLVE